MLKSLSVSNLAWDLSDEPQVFKSLRNYGIDQIEGVISKLGEWDKLSNADIIKYKLYLEEHGIQVKSLQSIFFNTGIEHLGHEAQVVTHIQRLIRICKHLGVTTLVFGSPTMRKKIDNWELKLKNLFTGIDYILDETNVELVIEPNAKIYNGEYFHTVSEIVEFITDNKLNNIKTMIDTHNIILENQNPIRIFEQYQHYIKHVHISEIGLAPFSPSDFHREFAKKLNTRQYENIITYEVLKHDDFEQSVQDFYSIYK